MSYRVTLQLCVAKGIELPKADRLSEIDPYIKISHHASASEAHSVTSMPAGMTTMVTQDKDDDPNPVWNEYFCIPVDVNEEDYLEGYVRFELWDKENVVDEFCGWCALDLSNWPVDLPEEDSVLSLPVEYAESKKKRFLKQKRNSHLVVRLIGVVLSHEDLVRELGDQARRAGGGNDGLVKVYAPVPCQEHRLYAGMYYGPRGVHFSVCLCEKSDHLHIDVAYYGEGLEESVTVARRSYANGKKLFQGAVCFQEAVLMGLPLNADFEQLLVSVEEKKAKENYEVEELLESAGWPGPAADFDESADLMQDHSAYADDTGIYIKLESPPQESNADRGGQSGKASRSHPKTRTRALLKLEYGTAPEGRARVPGLPPSEAIPSVVARTPPGHGPPMLHLCVVRDKRGTVFEWENVEYEKMESYNSLYMEPLLILDGKFECFRVIQAAFSDMPANLALKMMLSSSIVMYRCTNYQDWDVKRLLNPRGEEVTYHDEEEDAAEESTALNSNLSKIKEVPLALFKGIGEVATTTAGKAGSFFSEAATSGVGFFKRVVSSRPKEEDANLQSGPASSSASMPRARSSGRHVSHYQESGSGSGSGYRSGSVHYHSGKYEEQRTHRSKSERTRSGHH